MLLAFATVAAAALWLARRALAKRKSPGCGHDCACPTKDLKTKAR